MRENVLAGAYDALVRRWRRRRPAGQSQVPISLPPSPGGFAPVEPALVRLAVDRTVFDAPWALPVVAIAHVWPDARLAGGWARVAWPVDVTTRRFVAPLDLQIGHVLEVMVVGGTRCFGWIADTDQRRFVLVPAADVSAAIRAAGRAVDVWHAAELAAIEDAWRARLERVDRLDDEAV